MLVTISTSSDMLRWAWSAGSAPAGASVYLFWLLPSTFTAVGCSKLFCLNCVNGPTTAGAAGAGQLGRRKRICIQAGVRVRIKKQKRVKEMNDRVSQRRWHRGRKREKRGGEGRKRMKGNGRRGDFWNTETNAGV